MKKHTGKITLQSKILVVNIILIFLIIFMLLFVVIFLDYKKTFKNKSDLTVQTAKAISYMNSVERSFNLDDPTEPLQALANQIEKQINASYVIIIDKEGKILTYPDDEKTGQKKEIDDEYRALVFGGYYSKESSSFLGSSVIGVAPIFNQQENEVIGVVTVGFLKKEIYAELLDNVKYILLFSLLILLISIIFSFILAKNILKDTYGLEPAEIAALYYDRNTILSSMGAGIIAIDAENKITLINDAAKKLLNQQDNYRLQPIQLFNSELLDSIYDYNRYNQSSFELFINNTPILLKIASLKNNQSGYVLTMIDKTGIRQLTTALEEVQNYSNDLRAQTHEFSNKLHVISGLIQLEEYDEVVEMIQREVYKSEDSNRLVFSQIKDSNVQAIILGKIGKASELGIDFQIDEDSTLHQLPDFIQPDQVSIIIGNLLDNAFDAVFHTKQKVVTFSAMDIGDDFIFEISDSGHGVPVEDIDNIFVQGYSTKDDVGRGYGLRNVQEILNELNAFIEVINEDKGTIFIVYIPKKKEEEDD